MESFFIWLESSGLSLWIRGETGSTMSFPIIIFFHALGMGFLVGIATVFNLRIAGLFKGLSLSHLKSFLPFALVGLLINTVSGLLLLVAYPTKALTNPLFYLKLFLIGLALWSLAWSSRHLLGHSLSETKINHDRGRYIAIGTCIIWAGAIFAGRFLAYTYTKLLSI